MYAKYILEYYNNFSMTILLFDTMKDFKVSDWWWNSPRQNRVTTTTYLAFLNRYIFFKPRTDYEHEFL